MTGFAPNCGQKKKNQSQLSAYCQSTVKEKKTVTVSRASNFGASEEGSPWGPGGSTSMLSNSCQWAKRLFKAFRPKNIEKKGKGHHRQWDE